MRRLPDRDGVTEGYELTPSIPVRHEPANFEAKFAALGRSDVLTVETVDDPMDLAPLPDRPAIDWMPLVYSARTTVASVRLGSLRLSAIRLPPCLFEGRLDDDHAVVWIPMEDDHDAVVNGRVVPSNILVYGAPGARFQAYWPLRTRPAQCAFGLVLRRADIPADWPEGKVLFRVQEVNPDGLSDLRDRLWTLFLTASEDPDGFAASNADAAVADLLQKVGTLFSGSRRRDRSREPLALQHLETMDRLDAMMTSRLDRPISSEDAARYTGVALRTLHNVTTSMRGMSLQTYVKTRKMRSARRHLLRGVCCDLVKQAALMHGYTHLGRFAQEYTKFFGEPPSATLARKLVDVAAPTNRASAGIDG